MKNAFISILLLSASIPGFAASRLNFPPMGMQMLVNITEHDLNGNIDSDPVDLYQQMNVDEQDSQLGKGKKIITPAKDFNIICSKDRRSCSIVLVKSANTVISGQRKYASFKLNGAEAAALTSQFKLNDRGEATFAASDKAFRIFGDKDSFIFEATGN